MMHRPLQKILHIDDDPIMRLMVKKALERSQKGFEVISCASPTEFLDHLISFKPDILIIDVMMPIMSGPALLEKIRKGGNNTAAIFMTGQESMQIDNRAILDPILGVIPKPFSPTALGDDLIRLWDETILPE